MKDMFQAIVEEHYAKVEIWLQKCVDEGIILEQCQLNTTVQQTPDPLVLKITHTLHKIK